MDPATIEEYNARAAQNSQVSGYGIEGVTSHLPCPFCAAADWLVVRLIDLAMTDNQAFRDGATCVECGRSAKFIMVRTDNSLTARLLLTGGEDPPPYLSGVKRV